MEVRVGRHLTGTQKLLQYLPMFFPEKEIVASWPTYEELCAQGCGAFLHNPEAPESAGHVYQIGPRFQVESTYPKIG